MMWLWWLQRTTVKLPIFCSVLSALAVVVTVDFAAGTITSAITTSKTTWPLGVFSAVANCYYYVCNCCICCWCCGCCYFCGRCCYCWPFLLALATVTATANLSKDADPNRTTTATAKGIATTAALPALHRYIYACGY